MVMASVHKVLHGVHRELSARRTAQLSFWDHRTEGCAKAVVCARSQHDPETMRLTHDMRQDNYRDDEDCSKL